MVRDGPLRKLVRCEPVEARVGPLAVIIDLPVPSAVECFETFCGVIERVFRLIRFEVQAAQFDFQGQPSTSSYYYSTDHLGTVRALTNDAGQVVADLDHDSYGNPEASVESVEQPFRFTGREYDRFTKLYHYRAREYDPVSGRFLQEDPIWFSARDMNVYRTAAAFSASHAQAFLAIKVINAIAARHLALPAQKNK